MKVIIKEVKRQVKMFVSNDGIEFETEEACIDHELSQNGDFKVRENRHLAGFANFCGQGYHGDFNYNWFHPDSEVDIEQLRKLYNDEFGEIDDRYIGKWICVEHDPYSEEISVTSLDDGLAYARNILEELTGSQMIMI